MKLLNSLLRSFLISVFFGSVTAQALAPSIIAVPSSQVAATPQFQPKITGMVYTATQYTSVSGDLNAWNLARVGYQFTENFNLSYNQILLNDYHTKANAGFNFRFDDAYLRLKWNEVFKITRPDLKFGLEQRYYIPTSSVSSEKTMVTGLRNRLLSKVTISDKFSLGIEESPVIFWYRDSMTDKGPNEAFRNYIVLTPTFTAMKGKLNAYMPIYLQNSLYRGKVVGTNNAGSWKHQIFLWPEVTYSVNDNLELGLAAISGSVIAPNFSELTFSTAFKNITTAFEVTLSL